MNDTKIRQAFKSYNAIEQYGADEALAFTLEADMSKQQYQITRTSARLHGADLYPSYHKILEVKQRCYPRNVKVTESLADIPLQNLLEHNCSTPC